MNKRIILYGSRPMELTLFEVVHETNCYYWGKIVQGCAHIPGAISSRGMIRVSKDARIILGDVDQVWPQLYIEAQAATQTLDAMKQLYQENREVVINTYTQRIEEHLKIYRNKMIGKDQHNA